MSAYYSASVSPGANRKIVTSTTRKAAFSRTGPVTAVGKALAQFRPVPIEPPPRPVWVHEKSAAVPPPTNPRLNKPEDLKKAKIASERADVNYINYQVYIRTYNAYVLELQGLKERFWANVGRKRKGPQGPEGDNDDAIPSKVSFKPSEPLDAAAMQRDKERKARRAAARRRQRAAKRERAREAKAKSLETQVEVAKLENQLRRAKGANIVGKKAVPGKGSKAAGEQLAAGRSLVQLPGATPSLTTAQLVSGNTPPPTALDNAAARRRRRRLDMFGVSGRTPDDHVPSAPR